MPVTPSLSVVMGVFNSEDYLSEAVGSILKQTHTDFEFIIIDDGSTDSSPFILDRFAIADSRVSVVHQENTGLTKSLNAACRLAKGKFIARMDADDVCLPHRFERQIEVMKNEELVLLGSEVLLMDPDGFVYGQRGHCTKHEDILCQLLKGMGGALTHPAVMFRRDAAENIGFYDENFSTCQDLDLFIRLAQTGKISNLTEPLLKWRQHSESVNSTRNTTWPEMKALAIRKAILMLGPEQYSSSLFFSHSQTKTPRPYEKSISAFRMGNRFGPLHYFILALRSHAYFEALKILLVSPYHCLRAFLSKTG